MCFVLFFILLHKSVFYEIHDLWGHQDIIPIRSLYSPMKRKYDHIYSYLKSKNSLPIYQPFYHFFKIMLIYLFINDVNNYPYYNKNDWWIKIIYNRDRSLISDSIHMGLWREKLGWHYNHNNDWIWTSQKKEPWW